MSEESATPDLASLNRQAIEAAGRREFDAAVSFYGPESVWDTSAMGMGTFRGADVIRRNLEEWTASYEDFAVEIEENRDLGGGVLLSVTRQRGRMAGSGGYLETWLREPYCACNRELRQLLFWWDDLDLIND